MKKILILITIITILILGFFLGSEQPGYDHELEFSELLPEAKKIEKNGDDLFFAYSNDNINACPSGFIALAECKGYSGPIQVAVAYNIDGNIKKVKILKHSETPSFFEKVLGAGFIEQFMNQKYTSPCNSEKIETVTGATLTSDGIIGAVSRANQNISENVFDENNQPVCFTGFRVGIKEIVLFSLFIFAIVLYYVPFKRRIKARLRLILQILSLILLGVIFTEMVSITHINSLLMGYFPANQLLWYLLLGLFIVPILILGINPYFFNICPFGVVQDLLAKIPAKKYNPGNSRAGKLLRFLPAILTLGVIFYALLTRKPGFFGHEIFSTVFQLQGSVSLFGLAAIIVVLAIFVKRPWCRYLCPVGAVSRFLMLIRSLFKKE